MADTDTADASEMDVEDTTTETVTTDTDSGFKSDESKQRVLADLKKAREDRKALEARLQEIEDAQKSDGEKLTDRLTAAEKRAHDAEQKALRLEVAAAKGLTSAQAKRLVGTTLDELEADADDLVASFTPAEDDRSREHNPTLRLRGGSDPTNEPEETDPRALAERAGRL